MAVSERNVERDARGQPNGAPPVSRPAPPTQEAEPMQVGRTSLTPEERSRRRQGNLCLYCGQAGHVPLPGKRPDSPVEGGLLVSHTSNLSSHSHPLCQARLLLSEGSHTLAVFIDSGSDINIIDEELARQLNIQQVPLPHPSPAYALDGHLVGTVTHQTAPLRLLLSGNHHETVE